MNHLFAFGYGDMSNDEIESALYSKISAALHQKYGPTIDPILSKRVQEEWFAIQRCQMAPIIATLHEIAIWLKEKQHPYWVSGCAGSSFIFYLLGITAGNPLPPHQYCLKCHSVYWKTGYVDGFDIPWDTNCMYDGTQMISDGHNLPWQTLWGESDCSPRLEIRLPKYLCNEFEQFLGQHWLRKLDRHACVEVCEIKPDTRIIRFSSMDFVFSLDTQDVNPEFHNVEIDKSCYEFSLLSWESLVGMPDDDEFSCEPNSFSDVLYIAGLVHSSGVWDVDTDYMIDQLGYNPSDMIAFRDDIFFYLMRHDFLEKDAQRGMRKVCKGDGLPVITDEMRTADDNWGLSRCEKIEYLFAKSHMVEYILFQLKSYL